LKQIFGHSSIVVRRSQALRALADWDGYAERRAQSEAAG
jgi:hypothetical protein